MTKAELTWTGEGATFPPMRDEHSKPSGRRWTVPIMIAATALLSGCISVSSPDKPIVIELNINIRQEVIYRLAKDADNTIKENADIF